VRVGFRAAKPILADGGPGNHLSPRKASVHQGVVEHNKKNKTFVICCVLLIVFFLADLLSWLAKFAQTAFECTV
jgi:hypothetical protein